MRYFGSYKIEADESLSATVSTEPIADNVWAAYEKADAALARAYPILSAFECAARNYMRLLEVQWELRDKIDSSLLASSWGPQYVLECFLVMNQHVINFVSSSRSFIEHVEGHLKRTFGPESAEWVGFRDHTRSLYDTHFSYRFVYALRNFAIHRELPLSNAGVTRKRDEASGSFSLVHSFTVDRDGVLERGKDHFNATLRGDLRSQPAEFDLLPLLEEQDQWNRALLKGAIERQGKELKNAHQFLGELKAHLRLPDDEVPVVWEGEERPPLRHSPIPFNAIERINRLYEQNGPSWPIFLRSARSGEKLI